ncbi:MAG: hypothetical protein MJ237_06580 [bacterium]|nr:hypothetical protein [bacterium]
MMIQALGKISRLKGFFRSGINYAHYDEMLGVAKRKASGSLPKDILSSVMSNNADKKTAIQRTEIIFNNTANILGEINSLEKQSINRLQLNNDGVISKLKYFMEKRDIKGFFHSDPTFMQQELETIIRAEEKMLNEIKQYLPNIQNVIITPLGSGMFKNGYKLQCIDKNGQKIFTDKVLKVYREDNLICNFIRKVVRYVNTLSDEELIKKCNKERKFFDEQLGITIPDASADELRKSAEEFLNYAEIPNAEVFRTNGAMAEANISEFLRYFSGHKLPPEEGIAIPSLFGLNKTQFSLGEYINNRTKAKKKFDFKRLFLQHRDLEVNPDNSINNICIDMGDIVPLLETKEGYEFLSNKQNIRILKSLLSKPKDIRDKILEEYKKSEIWPKRVLTKIEQIP